MTRLIMSTFDYWVMWHFALAILLFFVFYRFTFNKHRAAAWTLGVAVVWEIIDSTFFGDSLLNSLIDWATALGAVFIIVVVLKGRRLARGEGY